MTVRFRRATLWIMVGLLLATFGLLTRGFAAQLPYHLDPDEPEVVIGAHELVTAGRVMILPDYPPLFMAHLGVERLLVDAITPGGAASDAVHYLFARVTSIGYALLFVSAAFRLGQCVRDGWTGLVFAAFFAIEPVAVLLYSLGKADSISIFLATCCIWLACVSVRQRRWQRTLALAFVAGIVGTLAKYNYALALIAPLVALAIRWWPYRWFRVMVGIGVIAGVAVVVLVFPNARFMAVLRWSYLKEGWQTLPSAGLLVRYITSLFNPLALLVAGVGLAAGLRDARRNGLRTQAPLLIMIVLFAASFVIYAMTSGGAFRHVYLLYLPIGICVGIGISFLARMFENPSPRARRGGAKIVGRGIALVVAGIILIPMLRQTWAVTGQRYNSDVRIAVGNWFVQNVQEPMGVAVEYDIATVSPQFDGMPFPFPMRRMVVDSLFDHTLDDYRREGMDYLVADSYAGGYFGVETLPADFQQQTREVFRAELFDRSMAIFELLPAPRDVNHTLPAVETEAGVTFGDVVTLYGYDLALDTGALTVTLVWQGMGADQDYVYFVHAINAETGERAAQIDTMPLNYGMSTSLMEDGEVVVDPVTLNLADAPDGCYDILLGWYAPDTGERLAAMTATGERLAEDAFVFPQQVCVEGGEAAVED